MFWSWLVACGPSSTDPTDDGTPPPTDTPITTETGYTSPPASHTGHTGHTATTVPAGPQNVLILLADDFGVDHVAAYHATDADVRTPVIDGLAAEGVLFENAWAYTACSPARAAMQTGRYARRTGYAANWKPDWPVFELPADEITLAELVSHSPQGAWQTSLVGKWHLMSDNAPMPRNSPHRHGWSWYQGALGATLELPAVPGEDLGDYYRWRKVFDDETQAPSTTYATTDNVDDAIGRVGAMTEPWLMVVSFNAIHAPLQPPPAALHTYDDVTESSESHVLARAMTEALDTEIGRLLAALPADRRARTTIVFLGDNGDGEPTLEAPLPNQREVNYAKGTLRDFGIRVPLIVSGPLVDHPGTRTQALASIVDLWPTVAEIADVDPSALTYPDGSPVRIDGLSLVPVLHDPTAPLHDMIFSERFLPLGTGTTKILDERAVRDGRYKYWVDALTGNENFYEYRSGIRAEGADQLPVTDLTPDQRAAYDRLRAAQEAFVQRMQSEL